MSARLDTCASCDLFKLLNCDLNVAIVPSGDALAALVSLEGSVCIVVDVGVSVDVTDLLVVRMRMRMSLEIVSIVARVI